MTLYCIANVGAEEPLRGRLPKAAVQVARLWSLLFPADAEPLGGGPAPATVWPEALGAAPRAPAFSWIPETGAVAWLNTEEAATDAHEAGVALSGAPPEVVRRVHDKAFAHAASEAAGLVPRPLRGLVETFAPAELADAETTARGILARVRDWPAWTEGRFTLKPRLGGSGRGRVAGDARTETAELADGLARLARRGGALLEPWLVREADLSTQLHVAPDGTLTLLGTLCLEQSASGVYRGHRASLDHRSRLHSGSRHDDALLEAATALAHAAHAEGFHGPCGVDAFVFRGPDGPVLRPSVELNARFTTGTLLRGLVRRIRPRLREHLPPEPGALRTLRFALAAPAGGWPDPSPDRLVVPLDDALPGLRPALVVERDGPPEQAS